MNTDSVRSPGGLEKTDLNKGAIGVHSTFLGVELYPPPGHETEEAPSLLGAGGRGRKLMARLCPKTYGANGSLGRFWGSLVTKTATIDGRDQKIGGNAEIRRITFNGGGRLLGLSEPEKRGFTPHITLFGWGGGVYGLRGMGVGVHMSDMRGKPSALHFGLKTLLCNCRHKHGPVVLTSGI